MTAFSTPSLSPAGEAALDMLVSCHPADLSRVAKLREVHSACVSAGVVAGRSTQNSTLNDADGASDVAQLHSLFDAAVTHGAGSLVCHYVDEVCGRDDFSSPDGVEAYLRDGEMVAEWCSAATRSATQALLDASTAAASDAPGAMGAADSAAAIFEATKDALHLLGASPEGEPTDTSVCDAQRSAESSAFRRKLQLTRDACVRGESHAITLSWLLQECLGGATTADRHGGPAAWTGSVRQRRAAATEAAHGDCNSAGMSNQSGVPAFDNGSLFLDDLLRQVGQNAPAYPFKSAVEAAERIFKTGSASPSALLAKRCLFLYYLLDAGAPAEGAPKSFATRTRVSPTLFQQTVCACYLDDWTAGSDGKSLDEAAALVPKIARNGMPVKFVAALVARGRPAAALAAQRARGLPTLETPLGGGDMYGDVSSENSELSASSRAFQEECDLAVTTRLECGLATEAYLVANRLVPVAAPAFRDELASTLASRIASHAASKDALASILELPFEGALETALCTWLRDNCGKTPGALAHFTVAYFLQRGRTLEAAAEAAAVAPPLPIVIKRELDLAVANLPEAMRRVQMDTAAAACIAAAGETRALARGISTAPATPSELATTAGGFAGVSGMDTNTGTLVVLDGPFDDSSVGGRPPFFAPPVFGASRVDKANTGAPRNIRTAATERSTGPLLVSPRARTTGEWTQLHVGNRAMYTGNTIGLLDDDELGDAGDDAMETEQIHPGSTMKAKESDGARKKRGGSYFVSPFGRQAAGTSSIGMRTVPNTAGTTYNNTSSHSKPRTRWAPPGKFSAPPKFGASATPVKESGILASARKSPRSTRKVNIQNTSEVVAMDSGGGGALLAGMLPVTRAGRSTKAAPASLFAGTTETPSRRATRSSSRLSEGAQGK